MTVLDVYTQNSGDHEVITLAEILVSNGTTVSQNIVQF
jgi:hypothetical protein